MSAEAQQAPIAASPLEEANALSLDEFFSRDPEGLTEKDIEVIVAELRRQRKNFKEAEARGESAPRARKPKVQKEELSLTDLGLG